jgi:hypothetical protein
MPETRLVNLTTVEDTDDVQAIDRRSPIGNPHVLEKDGGDYTREESVLAYATDLHEQLHDPEARGLAGDELRAHLDELRGETLGCWCVPELCHGHVILYWLDQGEVPGLEDLRDWGAPERTTTAEATA